jgi:hypothetical protein
MAVVAIVAVAAVTALAQNYQAAKARKANQAELDKIKAAWDSLVPPDFDVSIMDPPELIRESPMLPQFDMSKFTPETYKVVGQYAPKLAPLIRESDPTLVKNTAEGKEGRQAQLDALKRMKMVADGGADPLLSGALDEASQRSQIESQSREGSILQDFARRGMMGSGQELAAKLASQQGAMTESAASSRQAAIESYKNRLQALRDSASLGGDISRDEFNQQSRNADIINSFNQRLSANAQANANMNTGIINDGKYKNLMNEQDVANKNVSTANEYDWKNKNRDDDIKTQIYGMQRDERDTQNKMTMSRADWEKQERDRQDKIKEALYNHKVNQTNGKSGLAGQTISMNTQNAADTNQAIQGAGNAATSAIMYDSNKNNKPETEEERKKRLGY